MTNIPQRKNVIKYQTSIDIPKENDKALIISKEQYMTNDETLLIVRSVNNSEVTLNSNITKRIVIKSLTSVLEKGSCVQFQFVQGNWYILSSDGLKMS